MSSSSVVASCQLLGSTFQTASSGDDLVDLVLECATPRAQLCGTGGTRDKILVSSSDPCLSNMVPWARKCGRPGWYSSAKSINIVWLIGYLKLQCQELRKPAVASMNPSATLSVHQSKYVIYNIYIYIYMYPALVVTPSILSILIKHHLPSKPQHEQGSDHYHRLSQCRCPRCLLHCLQPDNL